MGGENVENREQAGITDQIPDRWRFSKERVDELTK